MRADDLLYSNYHAKEAFSYSIAKQILNNPNRWALGIDKPRTQALDFGSLAHDLVLSPNEMQSKYLFAQCDKIDFRTAEGKGYKAQAEADGLILIDKSTYNLAKACINANSEVFDRYLNDSQGECEVSFFEKIDNIEAKCRCDFFSHDENRIIDLKFVKDATPQGFAKACAEFGYHIQNAFYCDLTGASEFLFIAIEKESPFLCGIYRLSQESVDLGRDLYKKALEIYKNRKSYATQCYKGIDLAFGIKDEVQTITLPTWAFFKNV